MTNAQSLRSAYGVTADTSDSEVLLQILRYVARAKRGDSELRSLRSVGPFTMEKTDDVSDAELATARDLLCRGYDLPVDASTETIIAAVTERGLEVVSYLKLAYADEFPHFHYVGIGAETVRKMFQRARESVRVNGRPAVIFIDDLPDMLGKRPTGENGPERDQVLGQVLAEMNALDRDGINNLLTSNSPPDVLDSALARPGRFTRS